MLVRFGTKSRPNLLQKLRRWAPGEPARIDYLAGAGVASGLPYTIRSLQQSAKKQLLTKEAACQYTDVRRIAIRKSGGLEVHYEEGCPVQFGRDLVALYLFIDRLGAVHCADQRHCHGPERLICAVDCAKI